MGSSISIEICPRCKQEALTYYFETMIDHAEFCQECGFTSSIFLKIDERTQEPVIEKTTYKKSDIYFVVKNEDNDDIIFEKSIDKILGFNEASTALFVAGYEMSYCPMPVGRRFVMVKTDEGYEELIFYPGSNLIFDSDPELIIYEKTDTEETHIDGFGLVKIVFENKKGREEEYFHVFKKSLSKDKALKEYYKVLNKYKSKYNVIKSYVNWYNEESGQVEYL